MYKNIAELCSIIIMLLISANIMARDIVTEVLIIGDTSYLDSAIEKEHIEHFSKHDLRLLRNTIFAKYGYEFTSEDLKKHFSRFSWYKGNKTNVQKELTGTDWTNVAVIQAREKSAAASPHSIGERFVLSEKIYAIDYPNVVEGVRIDGEIIAFANKTEIARAKIIDNEFELYLNEVPPEILKKWDAGYAEHLRFLEILKDSGVDYPNEFYYCSDPETQIADIKFEITGTVIDLLGKKRSLYSYYFPGEEDRIGVYRFSYVYADRDAIIRRAGDDRNDFGLDFKWIRNEQLKKGWNKLRHHQIFVGNYGVTGNHSFRATETTSEKGVFNITFHEKQTTTLQGEIVIETDGEMQGEYYLVLDEPLITRKFSNEKIISHRVLLLFDPGLYEIPGPGKYMLYGDIDRTMRMEKDVMFHVVEIEKRGD